MMENHKDFHHNDLLDRAVDAVLSDPIPADLRPDQVAQLVAVVRHAADQPFPISIIERVKNMKPRTRIAVAATALIVFFGLMSLILPGGVDTPVFADVADALNSVHSATWKTTTVTKLKLPGEKEEKTITMDASCKFLAPSNERSETTVEGQIGSIYIVDGQKDKAITLVPATKTATVINTKNFPLEDSPFGKTFQGLRELAANAQSGKAGEVERLGAKTIDARPAEGFRIKRISMNIEIWADPKSLLPIRVEYTTTDLKGSTVMTDFQINVPLDESLFDVDVPPDYTVQLTTEVDLNKGWTMLAGALKMAAECNEGVFPPALVGDQGIVSVIQRGAPTLAKKHKGSPDELQKLSIDVAMNVAAFSGFLNAAPPETLHYAGKDVKLGTPNRPILWLTQNKSGRCMVFYADLSVKEVSSEETLKFPNSDGGPKPQKAKSE